MIKMIKTLIALAITTLSLSNKISSCPKYQCQSATNTTCVYLASATNTGLGFNKIDLFDNCKNNQYCDSNIFDLQDSEYDETDECKDINIEPYRFAGEDCESDNDCSGTTLAPQKCDQATKKCMGFKEGAQCSFTQDCVVGLYCDDSTSTCIKQKGLGEVCKDITGCQNTLLCYFGKCSVAPYSLPIETEVPTNDWLGYGYYCNRMNAYTDSYNRTICAALNQTISDGEEYAKCNYGDSCNYKIGPTDYTLDCQCGANADGQGYCPQGQNLSKYKR
jgi:hypothetical protein